jgi:hypothetical protein
MPVKLRLGYDINIRLIKQHDINIQELEVLLYLVVFKERNEDSIQLEESKLLSELESNP